MAQIRDLKTGIKYKNTPIGKIPVDWEVVGLLDICSISSGKACNYSKNAGEKAYLVYGSNGILGSHDEFNFSNGLVIGRVGASGSIHMICSTIWASDNTLLLSITDKSTQKLFIYYYLQKCNLPALATKTAQPLITQQILKSVLIAKPPFPEQKRIAEFLSTVDEATEKTTQIIEKIKETKKGLMQQLLTRGIGHKKFKETEIGEIPVEWEVGAFSEIADINPKRDLEKGVSYPFVEMAAIESEFHKVQFSKPRKYEGSGTKFQNGDTLFARITPCTENGKTAYVDFLMENNFGHGSTEFIVLGPHKNVDSKFIYYCAKWDKVRNIAISKMEGTSGRQRVPSRVFLEDIFIPMPPLPEQKQIAEILSSIDVEIQKETDHKEQLELLKKGLMQVLLTGKIRVSV